MGKSSLYTYNHKIDVSPMVSILSSTTGSSSIMFVQSVHNFFINSFLGLWPALCTLEHWQLIVVSFLPGVLSVWNLFVSSRA